MQGKRHDRVVEMRLCFFSGKVGDYKVPFKSTRKCRSTAERRPSVLKTMREQVAKLEPEKNQPTPSHDKGGR